MRAAFKSGRKHTILPSSVVYALSPSKQVCAYCSTPAHSVIVTVASENRQALTAMLRQRLNAEVLWLEDIVADMAEDMAKEEASIQEATARAKTFRARLDEAGLTFIRFRELMSLYGIVGDIGHNLLLEWERKETS